MHKLLGSINWGPYYGKIRWAQVRCFLGPCCGLDARALEFHLVPGPGSF